MDIVCGDPCMSGGGRMALASRMTLDDWLVIGLDQLARVGAAGVTIEALCARTGRSKGSFYHHFSDMDAFAQQLMARWEREQTDHVLAGLKAFEDPEERMLQLDECVLGLDVSLERAIRSWAAGNGALAEFLVRVDRRRMAALEDIYRLTPGSRSTARHRAAINYAAFVGFLDLSARHDWMKEEADALSDLLRRCLSGKL